MRRWTALSLLIVAALFGHAARQPAVAAALALALVAAGLSRREIPLGQGAARALTGAAVTAGAAVGWLLPPSQLQDTLSRPWSALALAGLFAGAARLVLPAATSRPFAFLPGLVAIMAAGESGGERALYVAAVAGWLACTFAGLRAGDPGRPALAALPGRDRAAAAALGLAAMALAAAAAAGLPPLSRWTERRVLQSLGGAETGFTDRLWLGSLDGMADSDEVVMRIEGPRTDYLRGAVFDQYELGRWGRSRVVGLRPLRIGHLGEPRVAGPVRAAVVSGARDRYFLPLGAGAVGAGGAGLRVDRFGVVRVEAGQAGEVSFDPRGPAALPPDEPGAEDLELPPGLRRPLGDLAAAWTLGAATPEAKVEAIVAHLRREFRYSRSFERRGADTLLDFLLRDRRGHCEYFATAAALLARAAGVPARAVAGYRVSEENTLGGYWVVRERNAHAWAEVHLPGRGFVTVDATPEDPLAGNAPQRTGTLRAALDLIGVTASRILARLTLRQGLAVGGLVIVVGLALRRLRRPRPARRREARLAVDPPPASLVLLLDALARRGLSRGEAEPLERLAARADEAGLPAAASLLRRWAALRYGGIGDAEALLRETAAEIDGPGPGTAGDRPAPP